MSLSVLHAMFFVLCYTSSHMFVNVSVYSACIVSAGAAVGQLGTKGARGRPHDLRRLVVASKID